MTPIGAFAALPATEPAARPAAAERDLWDRMWGQEGFSFGALLDIVNPLHHIPVVSTIYRALSGDTIGPAPRMMGGALFGGAIGLMISAADSAVQAVTGRDTGEHLMAMMPEPDPPSQWADDNERRALRPLMAGLMNQGPTPPATLFAGDLPPETAAPTAMSQFDGLRTEPRNAAANTPARPGAVETASWPLPAPPRAAQMGAGGRQVPLTAKGYAGATQVNLPTPQTLAADPALLREMRESRAAITQNAGTQNAGTRKNDGRIDTAIDEHGLVSQGPAQPLMNSRAPRAAPSWRGADAAIPEVTPDFLMKMQQALEKYQAIRPASSPSVDLSR